MFRNKKFLHSLLTILTASVFLLFLSSYTFILFLLLILLGYVKHKLSPIKKEFEWFVFICVGGALIEILLVNIGGAWQYTNRHLFNIPIWMPLFWGVIGTSVVGIYEEFVRM